MGCKAALLVAVGLVMIFCAVQANDVQQQNAKRKMVNPTNTPKTLSDVVNMLRNLEKRSIRQFESKRSLLLRGRRGGRDGSPRKPVKHRRYRREALPGFDLRLVGGTHNNSGRLEIRVKGQWGTVCDKGWDINASNVACRMLGFARALKFQKFQQGNTAQPIWLQNISCVGCERSLDDCYHPVWGSKSTCDHSNDIGLVCLPDGPPNLSAKVMADGRIEISYYGVNRSICYDGLDTKDAWVICRMNGYNDVAYITQIPSQAGNPRTEEVWLLNMACNGYEKSIKECSNSWNWENKNCEKNNNLRAGIVCKRVKDPLDVEFRLEDVTTAAPYSGRLTVKYYRIWGNICAKDLKLEDAHVICKMLNFTGALTISHWGKHTGNLSFELVNHCKGTETSMKECQGLKLEQVNTCEGDNYAGVVCTPKTVGTPTPLPQNVRLRGGSDNARGRVEVKRHKVWGTVCNSGWDMREANVVCRMRGFDSAVTAYKSYGEGTGPIWMSGLQCKGSENNIEKCTSDGQEKTTLCNHGMDAGVVCRRYKDIITVDLENRTSDYDGRVTLKVKGSAGSICGNGWNKKEADVACQMEGFKQALVPISHFGGGPAKIWLSNVRCSNSDKSLKECNHDGWIDNSCPKNHHAGVICERPGVNDPNFGMRLVKVPGTILSKVEVQYYGVWGAVSANNWNLADANVACWRNNSGKASTAGSLMNDEKLPILIDNLDCRGSENSIEDCGFKWGISGAKQSKVAAVGCTPVTIDDKNSMTAAIGPGQNTGLGQVEIRYKTNDYAVCGDDRWDIKDADVICRMNNFKYGAMAAIRKYTIDPKKPFLTGFECRGTETGLDECFRVQSWTCSGNFIAGVMCKPNTGVRPQMKLRLADNGRVEVSYGNKWGTICNDGNSQQNARVICRMLGYVDFGVYGSTSKTSGLISWLGNMQCRGTEKSIEDCKPRWGEATCNDDKMLRVTCKIADAPHFQILGNDAIAESTVKIHFQNLGSILGLKAIYQIAVERRPYEERLQSFNTQQKRFEFKIINYTTSANLKHESYITAEIDSSYLLKNNFTIGDLSFTHGNDGFTNEPLQPETPYRVYVRIATDSHDKTRIYGDYSFVAFKTNKVFIKGRAKKSTSRSDGAVIGMSILIIILIAVIIGGSVWFFRRQRNEEVHASDKSQGLEMTDSPAEKDNKAGN
ncbi:scavenger receptor cysteine-rich type 1 protein M130-like [Actinia tenebrosa]|uniref:Scavenger receptor cysteine-rich type 1 protein M130-like n=1 Tax=Actinia tenebrosa TaxID=6105 RepID=A0A6P8ID18_ACTTE|nr:scavenger receptor cysteine-rich type 1 protein M130-like [Actinia tenebrosa]